MLTFLTLLQLVLYIPLLALLGQGLLYVLAGQKRQSNFFYQLLVLVSKPFTWVVRRINERAYILCDCCGSIRHFKGGVSSYLQEHLGVPEYARCDFSDEEGGGLHRNRVRR